MIKAIIVYGSNSGETEWIAETIGEVLRKSGFDVSIKDVVDIQDPEELLNYDLILLGSSTWNFGELQQNMKAFEPELQKLNLAGKFAAAFGSGDKQGYADYFCKAVDILEEDLLRCGAEIVMPSLKVDESEDRDKREEIIKKWTEELVKEVKEEIEMG